MDTAIKKVELSLPEMDMALLKELAGFGRYQGGTGA